MTTAADAQKKKIGTQFVYPFGKEVPAPPLDRNLLGGKGVGLAEMASIGLPVPPGFIITTEACNTYRKQHKHFPEGFEEQVHQAIQGLEKLMGQEFGSETDPLLISVRSGARVSMPGMMDTVLNLGLNDRSVIGFAEKTQNERLAYDSYRRFIMMYANIVEGIDRKHFEHAFSVIKMQEGVEHEIDLSVQGLKEACSIFKKVFKHQTDKPFPEDAYAQLFEAIKAVFNSWDSERATLYRQLHRYPSEWGTAVNVQAMVFGNKGDRSATGVAFTRDPATGVNAFYGEFLLNAQGEDVVAGIRTPHPVNEKQKALTGSSFTSLEKMLPEVYQQLLEIVAILEKHYKEMQDIEFTIEEGTLYMLQTRTGKRTGLAAIRMAIDMLEEGLIDEKEALGRIEPEQITQLLSPVFDQKEKDLAKNQCVAKGLNAGPGAASGRVAFSKEKAVDFQRQGMSCILVREESNPDDFPGLVAAEGILTLRGGSTSHAAVVARGMGKPCVVGCGALHLQEKLKKLTCGDHIVHEGDPISIDGTTGEVYFCELNTSPSEVVQILTSRAPLQDNENFRYYQKIMELADKYRTLRVRTNADTPQDSAVARAFGAEGIGLCRTEHMFMDPNRLNDVRCMFFSSHEEERKRAIARLLPHQKEDFIGIFRAMDGLPVTIRLLDPPLHEFMPHNNDELNLLAEQMGVSREKLGEIRASLEEQNPMLGHRGCRLGIIFPEITKMQTEAILEAAIQVAEEGISVHPEIMIPLVGVKNEIVHQKGVIENTAAQVFEKENVSIPYTIGTMIELPRSALIADQIAEDAAFFSFGTNDLTQTTFGISRDDSGKFVPLYVLGVPGPGKDQENMQILSDDPFQVIDTEGVGALMKIAVQKGRHVRPDLKCGICGEHGGDPRSITFCHQLGLDYVSCSPYRVPVARVAAARANLS